VPQLRLSRPFLLFLLVLASLLAVVQLGAITLAFDKLGLSPQSAFLLLFGSLFGSTINLPLFVLRDDSTPVLLSSEHWRAMMRQPVREFAGETVIAVNLGGCVVPVAFSVYLLLATPVSGLQAVLGAAAVAALARLVSRPMPGIGIGMPVFVAPLAAVAVALLINPEQRAPLAYIAGTLGVLVGADLLRLPDIHRLGAPFASIGGAGNFDGIFLTGIMAVLLT
jgi:uncharacterized membrane protein